jgi:hypothetical protein
MKWNFAGSGRALTRMSLFFGVWALSSFVQAQEWVEFYNNTRSLGMGGAGVAITSDETALFRNPANLGSLRGIYGTFLDPELEGSSNFVNQVSSTFTSKAFDIESVKTVLDTNRDQYYHARMQVTPSFVFRNFGVGLIYRNQIHAQTEATGTTMDTFYQNDMGVVLGANLRLFDGRIKIGGNAKIISRIEVINPTLATAGPFDLATIGSEGTGLSYDAGILIQLPWTFLPTIGAVARDVGDTTFDKRDGFRLRTTGRPATVKQSVDVGLSLFPIHGNQFRSVWTLEYVDATNSRDDKDNMKRARFGFETNWRDIFFFRLGMHQRYWTAGFEVASERISWQIASYGEEIGSTVNGVTTTKEDRRLNTKFSVRF